MAGSHGSVCLIFKETTDRFQMLFKVVAPLYIPASSA